MGIQPASEPSSEKGKFNYLSFPTSTVTDQPIFPAEGNLNSAIEKYKHNKRKARGKRG